MTQALDSVTGAGYFPWTDLVRFFAAVWLRTELIVPSLAGSLSALLVK